MEKTTKKIKEVSFVFPIECSAASSPPPPQAPPLLYCTHPHSGVEATTLMMNGDDFGLQLSSLPVPPPAQFSAMTILGPPLSQSPFPSLPRLLPPPPPPRSQSPSSSILMISTSPSMPGTHALTVLDDLDGCRL